MLYTTHLPRYPLSQFVDCFWHVSGVTPYNQEKVLPGLFIELMFNLGACHKVYDNGDLTRSKIYQRAWIAGLQMAPITMEAVAETEMYGIRFKPGGAYAFFEEPVVLFRNQIVEMDSVWGALVAEIREQLAEVDTLARRFAVLEALLRSDLYGWQAVQFAVQEIIGSHRFVRIGALSERIGWSQKHLINQSRPSLKAWGYTTTPHKWGFRSHRPVKVHSWAVVW